VLILIKYREAISIRKALDCRSKKCAYDPGIGNFDCKQEKGQRKAPNPVMDVDAVVTQAHDKRSFRLIASMFTCDGLRTTVPKY